MKSTVEASNSEKIERLERRLKRERAARQDAEAIADRGMRELWLANRELDKRVAERTADLEETLRKLELASTARIRFLATLSHEIRTPLNGTLGMLELLSDHVEAAQGHSYLASAQESAERLQQLLLRLMDLVEITTGGLKITPDRLDPDSIAESVRGKWQKKALRSGHLLSTTSYFSGQTVFVDQYRVKQIIDELLDNAVVHANKGALKVSFASNNTDLVIEVQDNGPGISDKEIAEAFTDFGMVDASTARASEGLGLGLGLSRRIAEAMGGQLSIESDGSTFSKAVLTIPAEIQTST